MEPPGARALRRAPDRLRDGLGGDDDRAEGIARVDEHRAGAKRLAPGIRALAALDGLAAVTLRHRAVLKTA